MWFEEVLPLMRQGYYARVADDPLYVYRVNGGEINIVVLIDGHIRRIQNTMCPALKWSVLNPNWEIVPASEINSEEASQHHLYNVIHRKRLEKSYGI